MSPAPAALSAVRRESVTRMAARAKPRRRFAYKDLRAVFIRDPDRNVIELDAYAGAEPEIRTGAEADEGPGYRDHP